MGQRPIIAANLNRICSWTSTVDRDGNTNYFGMNYRGQALVNAVLEQNTGHFIFTEQLYNADGMVVQERRPTRGPRPWQAADGSSLYTYDEIVPSGNRSWNGQLPFLWSRRLNLIRVEERPAGLAVLDELETASGSFVASRGRYQNIAYEPLFNQVRRIEEGSIELRPVPSTPTATQVLTDISHTELDYIFDYQELTLTNTATISSTFAPILDHFMPWGFVWFQKKNVAGAYEYDYDAIGSWQLPLEFYGEDINGDGSLGFGPSAPIAGAKAFLRARGVPILAVVRPSGSPSLSETTTLVWAPHGQPAIIRGPGGTVQVFEYYSKGSAGSPPTVIYGQNRPPTDQEANTGYRGFLARVRTLRFPTSYAEASGPQEAPCAALAGPYQWLLPTNCSSNFKGALRALGLAEQTATAIVSSTAQNAPDRWLTTSFSYAEIGLPRFTWTDTGVIHVTRDVDGRTRQLTDPLGNTMVMTYTVHGDPERAVLVDARGKLLRDTFSQFDEEGRVIYECAALAAGGCEPLGGQHPISGTVQMYTYWPEGSLRKTIDPEGLETEFEFNERQLLTVQLAHHPGFPNTAPRQVTYDYNPDGDVVSVQYGAPGTAISITAVLSETFAYDGLRRLTIHRDTRQYQWQYAYSSRDLLTHSKRGDEPYGTAPTLKAIWETAFTYDPLRRLLSRADNGTVTARYTYTAAGWIATKTADGYGTSYITYDLLGQPVWSRDAAGNQKVVTWTAAPHIATTSLIRTDGQGTNNTTTTILELDRVGQPITQTLSAAGNIQRWTWLRDGAGNILEARNPEGYLTKYERNLLGWPHHTYQQRTRGTRPAFDITQYIYNRRGQTEKLIDPAGQVTEYQYEPFGDLYLQHSPGQPQVAHAYTYDNLGRVDIETIGAVKIKHDYDQRGDPTGESYQELGAWVPMSQRTFDELGRVREARNFNPALRWLSLADRTVTQHFDYDTLGRVTVDGLQVGLNAPHDVISRWKINAQRVWERELVYVAPGRSTTWIETFDKLGRLASKVRVLINGSSLETTFQWMGDWYIGRTQQQEGHSSLFRERRSLDAFGRPLHWTYTAIDLDQAQRPLNVEDGAAYCGDPWNTSACARPLLQIDAVRDVMGRIASLQWRFGHPVRSGGTVSSDHPAPWRGYTYNPLGQLIESWEHTGTTNPVTTTGLTTHAVTAADIQRLGRATSADVWEYVREPSVGGTLAIRNPATNAERWSLPVPRGPGHQIQTVAVDGISRTLNYDAAGRLVNDGTRGYAYDPRGQLAVVLENRTVAEAYAYDASGRLAAVFSGNQAQPTFAFAYDGAQMVAAFDQANTQLWQAAWGPGIDQLIEWRNLSGGPGDYIPLIDHRNSIVAAWNVQRSQISQTAEYNAEGRLMLHAADDQVICQEQATGQICPNPGGIPFGFTSAWRSSTTGLVYMRNRWYSPELAEFVSQDPLGYTDSYNSYAYVGFDPINRLDPWGLGAEKLAEVLVEEAPKLRLVEPVEAVESATKSAPVWEVLGITAHSVGVAAGVALGLLYAGPPFSNIPANEWEGFENYYKVSCCVAGQNSGWGQIGKPSPEWKPNAPPVASTGDNAKMRKHSNWTALREYINSQAQECFWRGCALKPGEGKVEHLIPIAEFVRRFRAEVEAAKKKGKVTPEKIKEILDKWRDKANDPRNLAIACEDCNSEKKDAVLIEIEELFDELDKLDNNPNNAGVPLVTMPAKKPASDKSPPKHSFR